MKRPKYLITSRRMGILLLFLTFLWIYSFINFNVFQQHRDPMKESERLKNEILDKSKQYVQALAVENMDGNIAEGYLSYDLKRTMAILLDSILGRLSKLEKKVDMAIANGTLSIQRNISHNESHHQAESNLQVVPNSEEKNKTFKDGLVAVIEKQTEEKLRARDLIMEPDLPCQYSDKNLQEFVHCRGKIDWMGKYWHTDSCYKHYGVDGSMCSIAIYLSEIENWCPVLPWRKGVPNNLLSDPESEMKCLNDTIPQVIADIISDVDVVWQMEKDTNNCMADIRTQKEPLFKLMADDNKFLWMKNRIDRMWDNKWVPAGKALQMKQDLSNRSKKRILIHLGLLTKESGFKIAESAFSGGPLGELVQWSDIIATLYVLGHDIKITTSTDVLKSYMKAKGVSNKNCPVSGVRPVDLIYIDIVGLKQFKKVAGSLWNQFSCMLRVIDTFGTEPAFNLDTYARKAGTKSVWGKWGLVPLQFMTMFPHTPDNSFMGFVVENDLQDEDFERPVPKQNDMAVVYGKKADMWLDSKAYLDIIHERFTLHGTVYANTSDDLMNIPRYVINHGILSGDQVQELLKKAKLFVGLGFPYDGPAPLEAIANGCVFLNPSFNPPLNSMNTKFFKGKPTLRELTSQHPYAEVYIGKPYVHTVSITNTTAFRAVLREIQETEYLKPYVPHEFTPEGMLQRLNAYIENQDFCSANPKQWPPLSALKVKISNPKESCKAVCMKNGLICEPSFFKSLNTQEMIEREGYLECKSVISVEDIYAPSFIKESNICHLEKQKLLFSCAGGSDTRNRVCPCRDFIKGQVSLCKDCL